MPPRRSSRAPSASLEAPPAAETAQVKRKRGQTADPDTESKENVAKPPSRTRRSSRSSVGPSSRVRTASRSKPSLPDVAESDDEGQADAPPPKKARPSIEGEVKEPEGDTEANEEQEGKLRQRGRRKNAKDNDMEVAESSSRPSDRRATTRSTRGARSRSKTVVDEDDEDREAVAPSEDDEEEEKVSSRKGRKPKAAGTRKTTKKVVKLLVDDDDDDLEPPPPAQSKLATGKVNGTQQQSPKRTIPEAEDDEEEKSLFEPPPISAPPTSLPPAAPEQPQGPQARLVIHKIVLVDFKSYAGRQEIGPFHKSFSAIVGPNGSGKSNTIDALLFVFGYRASKMRQGKISELIHNSANYPDLDECSVEIHFREIIDLAGPDAFSVVPDSQLIVTRTAYKNNSSKYAINGRGSSYSEVQTLLKGRGIDLDHNRFLILQGEVESIAQMKPKAPSEHEDGLLEYLEDIIGTAKYKEPIDEAMVEVERLQEDRQIKLNRLRLVEKEKAALEERKKEAEDYLRLKNELVRARSREIQWYLWKFFEMENKTKAQISKLKKDLEKEVEQHKDDIEHLELLRKHYEEREKAYEEVQAAAAAALKDLAQFERQEIGLQEKRKHTGGRIKKLKKAIADDTTAHKTALNTIRDSSAKVNNEKQKVEDLEKSLDKEEKVLEGIQDGLKNKTQVFHDKIQEKQKELQPWTAQINTKQAEIDVATSERDALVKKAEVLKTQIKESEEMFSSLQSDCKTKVEHQNEIRTEKGQLQKRIQEADKHLKVAQAHVQEWRGKAATSRNKVEEARASQSENKTRNNVLDSLTRLKEAGKVQGFHGRLGNLGAIPDKYDVAISTACGGALNNMVVDRVEQAQTCIEYLRKNNVGRASFMVLEKLNPANMGTVQTPENVPRLLDLVKPKSPEYLPAFSKALGSTLVAKDMDQANRIAFGGTRRWRVVTLDGGLIETSGAMSGGGSQPSRGAMSSKFAAATISPQVVQSYERENEQAMEQLQKATAELREAEVEFERLTSRDPEIDLALQKLGMDIENSKKRIAEAERRVKELSSQNKPNAGDLSRITNLEREITGSQSALNKLQEKSSRIEQDIKDLENKILEIGGSRLLAQKSKVDGIKTLIGIANDEITKAEVAKNKAEKDSARLEATLASNSATLEELQSEMQQLEERLEELANEVAQLREKVEAAQAAADNSKEDLENLKAELDAKEDEISGFRQREMKLKQSIGDYEKELKEVDRGIEEYNQAHDELKLEEIEGDDDDEDDEANEDEQGNGEPKPAIDQDPTEARVKAEPGEREQSRKKKGKTPANELPILGEDELRKFRKEELLADVVHLQEQIAKAKPDLSVLKEYKQREQEFMNRAQDLEKITAERDAQKARYEGLRKQRLDEFLAGFNSVSLKLKEMYQMITLGGNAELELVDSLDPFSEGIIFSVMPPKKSWKNISNLSGGEKTLSSLALVFALHVFKPTPLYFMDEIDAALDFRNVSIVANYIKDRTKNAQFIIISLRNDMFELSHRLIGIYKTSNQTRSISIDNHSLQTTIPALPPQTQADV